MIHFFICKVYLENKIDHSHTLVVYIKTFSNKILFLQNMQIFKLNFEFDVISGL